MIHLLRLLCCSLLLSTAVTLTAQSTFWVTGQLRPRLEFRQGFLTLRPTDAPPAAYIEQRTRLGIGYKTKWLTLWIQPQDVRVWGSETLINSANSKFTLFQGWAKIKWAQHWSFTLGRQVWSYDNQRILGGLDWAAPGRAHDGVLLSYENDSAQIALQVGAAYNNEGPALSERPYTMFGNYKTLQFARFHKRFETVNFSLLALNIGRQDNALKFYFDLTVGGVFQFKKGGFGAQAEGYYQTGYNEQGAPLSAYMATAKLTYQFGETFSIGLGGDLLSGYNGTRFNLVDTRFNPWLGTNHLYYGHLDYFYVVGMPDVGLIDAYAELFYTPSKKLRLGLRYHYFHTQSEVFGPAGQTLLGAPLGHEVDLMGHYVFRKGVKLSFGYAQIWGTETLELIKPGDADQVNHWAWLMFDINLELFRTSIKNKK